MARGAPLTLLLATLALIPIGVDSLGVQRGKTWLNLGTMSLVAGSSADSLDVTGVCEPLSILRVKAINREVRLRRLSLHYADGSRDDQALDRTLAPTAWAPPITLPPRRLVRVELTYDPPQRAPRNVRVRFLAQR